MKIVDKLKTVAVKCMPPRRSRTEWLEKGNVGFESKYRIGKTEGIGRSIRDQAESNRRYAKNFARIQGLCKGCEHFNPDNKTVGGHCRLKDTENCSR